MAQLLGHRQTKETATDKPNLLLPRHIPTLPREDKLVATARRVLRALGFCGCAAKSEFTSLDARYPFNGIHLASSPHARRSSSHVHRHSDRACRHRVHGGRRRLANRANARRSANHPAVWSVAWRSIRAARRDAGECRCAPLRRRPDFSNRRHRDQREPRPRGPGGVGSWNRSATSPRSNHTALGDPSRR